jgi:ribosomal-protein-alanine N-acetyltransferase
MNINIETNRLILRPFLDSDAQGIFEMDSDPEVHTYLGNNPITTMAQAEEVVAFIRGQYEPLGTGRLAMIEKNSGNFVGWTGLKLVTEEIIGLVNFYDLGYRLARKYWGKGYATESAIASLDLGFGTMNLPEIYAESDVGNDASNHILQKVGMTWMGELMHYGRPHFYYKITREEWEQQ